MPLTLFCGADWAFTDEIKHPYEDASADSAKEYHPNNCRARPLSPRDIGGRMRGSASLAAAFLRGTLGWAILGSRFVSFTRPAEPCAMARSVCNIGKKRGSAKVGDPPQNMLVLGMR